MDIRRLVVADQDYWWNADGQSGVSAVLAPLSVGRMSLAFLEFRKIGLCLDLTLRLSLSGFAPGRGHSRGGWALPLDGG